jgi:hypothetical protein
MILSRIINLLQITLFLLFCIVGFVFCCVDVYWYYILDDDAKWQTIVHHNLVYELLWYLDCLTYIFMYLYIAVKLLRLSCSSRTYEILRTIYLPKLFSACDWVYRKLFNFDTLFKITIIVIGIVILKHALGHDFKIPHLIIISDIRPMANIWYDIVCPLRWIFDLVW